MRWNAAIRPAVLRSTCMLAFVLCAPPVDAQILEVVVGVTPTCPYGMSSCWGGASEGLSQLSGVQSVAKSPDVYNCTAHVFLDDSILPDVDTWAADFKAIVGEIHIFRGVELTVRGVVQTSDDGLVLRSPGLPQPIRLARLEHKLQWNFKKRARRGPEPDEQRAYEQLVARHNDRQSERPLQVEVTGPLLTTKQRHTLEVREFYALGKAP